LVLWDSTENVVSVLAGINDVWQLMMETDFAVTATDPNRYEVTYDQLLSSAWISCCNGCKPPVCGRMARHKNFFAP
jgi:hypothetical protein